MNFKATALFLGTSLVIAILVAGMIAGGWRPGSLDNSIEWMFWLGAAITAGATACFGFAARGEGTEEPAPRSGQLVKDGIMLFMAGPGVCVIAVIVNSWI